MFKIVLLCMTALILVSCYSNSKPDRPTANVLAKRTTDGYEFFFNKSPVTHSQLAQRLMEYSKVKNKEYGLEGRDVNDISTNEVQFSARPDVSTKAFFDFVELAIEARIYKFSICLQFEGATQLCHSLEGPKDESIGLYNTPYFKQIVVATKTKEHVGFSLDIEQNLDSDESDKEIGNSTSSSKSKLTPKIDSSDYKYKKFNKARKRLSTAMKAHIANSELNVERIRVNIGSDLDFGIFFLCVDAGLKLNLEHPLRWY